MITTFVTTGCALAGGRILSETRRTGVGAFTLAGILIQNLPLIALFSANTLTFGLIPDKPRLTNLRLATGTLAQVLIPF